MKVAVLSDIHSNYHALKACYEDAEKRGAERFIFLGDYVSDLAQPRETMDLVYEIQSRYPTVCLMGNRERYMLEYDDGTADFTRGSKSGSLLFTYEHLRKKDLDFFRGLKISDTIEIEGVSIEIAHASMENDRFYFDDSDGRTAEIFPRMKCGYLLTGHSHKQYIRSDTGKTIINPGAVGLPHGGTPWPKYAMLEVADGEVTCVFREVAYDLGGVIHAQFDSGLADCANCWAIGVLYDILTGEERVMELLDLVQRSGGAHDEAVWRSAAAALGMKFTEREIMAAYRETVTGPCGRVEMPGAAAREHLRRN